MCKHPSLEFAYWKNTGLDNIFDYVFFKWTEVTNEY